MKNRLSLLAGLFLLGSIPATAFGQTTGAVALPTPHYGMSEGTVMPAGSAAVPFVRTPASVVPAPQPLPDVGSPGFFQGIPRIGRIRR